MFDSLLKSFNGTLDARALQVLEDKVQPEVCAMRDAYEMLFEARLELWVVVELVHLGQPGIRLPN